MSQAYRSAYHHIVGMRLAEMKLAREVVEPYLPRLRQIRAARIARMSAGAIGIAGAIAVVILACLGEQQADLTYALVASMPAALVTYLWVRVWLGLGARFRRPVSAIPKLTGHLDEDLARIAASDPLPEIQRRLGSLEVWSTSLPLAALSLLMPLTLHYVFTASLGESANSFGRWIWLSLIIVGHAHLALMALAIAFARKMRKASSDELARMAVHREWAKAWGITLGVSAVPGVVLIAAPPLLTAITGLAFIPFMFVLMRRRLMSERSAIELAGEAVHVRVDVDAAPAALEEAAWDELATAPETERSAATSRV